MKKIISLFICALFFGTFLFSQESLKSTEEEYYDFLSLQGLVTRPTLGYRTLSDSVWTFVDEDSAQNHVWKDNNLGTTFTLFEPEVKSEKLFVKPLKQGLFVKVYGPEWFNSYNTAAPYGQNDGALWQGKGYNTSLTTGLRLEGYGFEATFKPQMTFSENREYEYIIPRHSNEADSIFKDKAGIYGYYGLCIIDAPQRFGDSSFWTFDWGDTEIRWTWNKFTLGFGTQLPWIGPVKINPSLGSNNAASYPKFDYGIKKTPILVPVTKFCIGQIEARAWVGRLSESDYFDNKDDNDYNWITGFNFSYSPFFAPDFSVGLTKLCLSKWNHFSFNYLNPFYSDNSAIGDFTGEGEDQKVVAFFQWNLPKVGLELYGEIAIDDYLVGGFFRGFTRYPFDTMIGTFGLQKSMTLSETKKIYGKLLFEWSIMELPRNKLAVKGVYSFNSHHQITQGFTNKGQYLGTFLANGGNAQTLQYTLFYPKGSTSFILSRNNPNLTYSYIKVTDENMNSWYKSNCLYGVSSSYFITKDLRLDGTFLLNQIINPLDITEDSDDIFNFHFELGCKYIF